MASRFQPRYTVDDVHRFSFDISGDREASDEEIVQTRGSDEAEGTVVIDTPENDDLPSTLTAPTLGRGRGRGRGRDGARRGVVAPETLDLGPIDEIVNKEYPDYCGRHGLTEFLPADSPVGGNFFSKY